METIIKNHLMQFVQSHNIISSNQHGFVQNRSTCTQLLEFHYDWSSGLDQRMVFFIVILIDFCKAFDVELHDMLIHMLSLLGIDSSTLA